MKHSIIIMALSLPLTDSSAIELENRKLYFNGGQHTAAAAKETWQCILELRWWCWQRMIGLIYEINVLVFHDSVFLLICMELLCRLSDLQDMTKNGI